MTSKVLPIMAFLTSVYAGAQAVDNGGVPRLAGAGDVTMLDEVQTPMAALRAIPAACAPLLPSAAHSQAAFCRHDGAVWLLAELAAGQAVRLWLPELGVAWQLAPGGNGTPVLVQMPSGQGVDLGMAASVQVKTTTGFFLAVRLPATLGQAFRFAIMPASEREALTEPVSRDFIVALPKTLAVVKAFIDGETNGITQEWRRYAFDFVLTPSDLESNGTTSLVLLSEDLTEKAWFDEVKITVANQDGAGNSEAGQNLVPNGSFEDLQPDGLAKDWAFVDSNNKTFLMKVVRDDTATGANSLYVSNRFPLAPYVYGAARTSVRLQPYVKYTISCQARGIDAKGFSLVLGKDWYLRLPIKGAFLQGTLYFSNLTTATPQTLTATLAGPKTTEKKITIAKVEPRVGSGPAKIPFAIPSDLLLEGPFTIQFYLGGQPIHSLTSENKNDFTANGKALDGLSKELATLKGDHQAILSVNRLNGHLSAPVAILDKTVADLEQLRTGTSVEERRYFNERCALALEPLRNMLAGARVLLAKAQTGSLPPATFFAATGPVVLKNGWPELWRTDSAGRVSKGPLFLAGYGHFEDAAKALPLFPKIGAGIIQVEIGPSSVFPRPGTKSEFSDPDYVQLDTYILATLKRASENGVMVNLLLSPHYMPDWYLNRHPEIKVNSGFLQYEVNHPKSRELMQAYLGAVLPRLAASPYRKALHGITLSNEPVYIGFTLGKPFGDGQFKQYLIKKFGSVEAFNRTTGSHFAGFDDGITAGVANPVIKYEFTLCRYQLFADWHRWMASQVKAALPEVPIAAKFMIRLAMDPLFVEQGVDPELYETVFDYSGNDNGMCYATGGERYSSTWVSTAIANEFQFSLGGKSIANTENHMIYDNDDRLTPPQGVHTAVFQQFLTGANSLVSWVWYDFTTQRLTAKDWSVSLKYNISTRPDCLLAQAEAGFDANRLGDQVRAFTAFKPEVAILYSPTAMIHDGIPAFDSLLELYERSAFSGYRFTFVTENKLETGRMAGVKTLFIPNQQHLKAAILPKLKEFAAQGGRIIVFPGSLKADEYGRPLRIDFPVDTLDAKDGAVSAAELRRHLAGLTPLPVTLSCADGSSAGVFFRTAPSGAATLVNIVNYTHGTKRVILKPVGKGTLVNLLDGKPQLLEYNLPPITPQLLEWTPAP